MVVRGTGCNCLAASPHVTCLLGAQSGITFKAETHFLGHEPGFSAFTGAAARWARLPSSARAGGPSVSSAPPADVVSPVSPAPPALTTAPQRWSPDAPSAPRSTGRGTAPSAGCQQCRAAAEWLITQGTLQRGASASAMQWLFPLASDECINLGLLASFITLPKIYCLSEAYLSRHFTLSGLREGSTVLALTETEAKRTQSEWG